LIAYRINHHALAAQQTIEINGLRYKNCVIRFSDKQAEKILWALRLVREYENVPRQYLKKLINTDGLWEIRTVQGGNAFRLLVFFDGNELVILTNGFQKKTQKTPKKEIVPAQKRKTIYLAREKNG